MMEHTQIVSWHASLARQYHRLERAAGEIIPIYAPGGYLPPFQTPIGAGGVTLKLLKYGTDEEAAVLSTSTATKGDMTIAKYAGGLEVLPNGLYYFTLTVGATTLYSDLIGVVDDRGFLKLEYWNHEEFDVLGSFFNFTSFKFRVYLKPTSSSTDVMGKPQYFYEEKVTRRSGRNFIQSIVSGKRYLFETILSEPQMDGLRLVKLFSDIEVTAEGITREVHDVHINPTWDDFGYFLMTVFEFDTDTVVKTIGKARVV